MLITVKAMMHSQYDTDMLNRLSLYCFSRGIAFDADIKESRVTITITGPDHVTSNLVAFLRFVSNA